jgi:hypothetical protein
LRVEIGSQDIVRVLQHIYNIGRGFILSIFAAGAAAAGVAFRISGFVAEAFWCAVSAGIFLLGAIYFMRKLRKSV